MLMDNSKKNTMGFLSFLPLIVFLIWTAYLLIISHAELNGNVSGEHQVLGRVVSDHYSFLVAFFYVTALLVLADLVYFVVHVARVKTMGEASKVGWIMFLSVFNIIAFPIFWFAEIRKEPVNLPTHADIA